MPRETPFEDHMSPLNIKFDNLLAQLSYHTATIEEHLSRASLCFINARQSFDNILSDLRTLTNAHTALEKLFEEVQEKYQDDPEGEKMKIRMQIISSNIEELEITMGSYRAQLAGLERAVQKPVLGRWRRVVKKVHEQDVGLEELRGLGKKSLVRGEEDERSTREGGKEVATAEVGSTG